MGTKGLHDGTEAGTKLLQGFGCKGKKEKGKRKK
jgi:hypothetical protein